MSVHQTKLKKVFTRTSLSMAVSLAALVSMSAQVNAQSGAVSLEEIVVTAQKREESLQDAAVSVTTLSGADLTSSGIKDPIEMQTKLPGVAFQVANTPVIVIRGVGTYNNQPGVDSAVAYAVDGTYLSHHPALMPIMFDISQIEAVRGPQGTLYGRNSNGGALNISTNKPDLDSFASSATVSFGNYSSVGTELMVNAPLSDTAAIRAAIATDDHNPYFNDGHQGADNIAGRVRLLLEPSDRLSILATIDHSKKSHRGQGSAYCPPNSAYAACATVAWEPYDGHGGDLGRAHFKIENTGGYVEMNYEADIGTVTSITNYREYDLENLWIWDFVDYQPDNSNEFFSQEVRLSSVTDSGTEWVTGAYYSNESFNATEYYAFFATPALNFAFDDGSSKSLAIFGQATYPLTESLGLTGGLRYTREEKSQSGAATVFDVTGTIPTTVATGSSPSKENKATWKLGLDYDVNPDSLLYGSVSNGFKSGGVNQVPPGLGLSEAYNPEEILAYQFGTKNRFMDNRVQLNAEIFYYDYEGYQQYSQESDPSGAFPSAFFITVDSQEATFKGGEVELSTLLGNNGVLDLSMAFVDAKFDQFVVGSINNTGNEVQGAPEATYSASYEHTVGLNNGAEMQARIESQYVAGHFVANNNAPGSYQDSYSKTGLSLSYKSPDRAYTITGFVNNLENEDVLASYADPISRGGDVGFLQAPRTYGVSFTWATP